MRLSRQFQVCLFSFKKRFRVHKNTSQAKINEQNKIKQTLSNKGNNFLCTQELLRGWKLFVLHFGTFCVR